MTGVRRKFSLGWLVALAFSLTGSAQAAAQASTPALTGAPDPGVASALAVFPGIVLHGAGSFYAGRPVTAVALLLLEAGGLYLGYRGMQDGKVVVVSFNEGTFTGESQLSSQSLGLVLGGVFLFTATWLYDLTAAPQAAQAAQDAARRRSQASLTLSPVITADRVGLVLNQSF